MADMKAFLKGAFPFIATAASMGGPFGAMAANALGKAIGVDKVDPSPDGIAQAIASAAPAGLTGDQLAAMKKAEQDFALQMQQLNFANVDDLEKIAADDRANARGRQIQLKDHFPEILATLVTIGFFFTLWFVFVHGVKPDTHDLAMTMVGTLGTAWVSVIAYYFGSSKGSDRKTELLAAAPAIGGLN
jgi:hypothetical protein